LWVRLLLPLFVCMSYFYIFFSYLNNADFFSIKKFVFAKYPYRLRLLKFYRNLLVIILYWTKHFFFIYKINYRHGYKKFYNYFLVGYIYIYKHLRLWVLPALTCFIIIYFSMYVRSINFFKVTMEWFLILNIVYWLMSGFVFFIKKYKFNRFTSAIQRFWRRSFIIFWLIESSLFIVFIYLLFNASQEPAFAFDAIQLTKQRVYSWKFFLFKSFFVFLILMLSYSLMLSLRWNIFTKYNYILGIITMILTYVVWLEFYQFFYIINWYGEISWVFDLEDKVWYTESVFKRARIVNHYVTICVIAKFWHIIYIYIFWVFFIIRSIEQGKVTFIVLSANFQNFLILYIMNWLLMYPWIKFVFRKFLTVNHKSFYEFRRYTLSGIYCDFFLFCRGLIRIPTFFKFFKNKNFFYGSSLNYGIHSGPKEFIRAQLVDTFLFINIVVLRFFLFSC
jgi:hypothetical protein